MLKSVIQGLFAIALSTALAFAGKPSACVDQPATITLADDPGGTAPGLFGDGQDYKNGIGATVTWNSCSGDAYLGLGGSARYFVLRFGTPLEGSVGPVPSWVKSGTKVTAQGSFYVRKLVTGTASTGMMIYFKGPDRKSYAFQFNNPCSNGARGGDPLLVNNPLLTSMLLATSSTNGSSVVWDIVSDTAAETCDSQAGTLTNTAEQAPVGTLMVQSGALYVNVAQFTFPVQIRVAKP